MKFLLASLTIMTSIVSNTFWKGINYNKIQNEKTKKKQEKVILNEGKANTFTSKQNMEGQHSYILPFTRNNKPLYKNWKMPARILHVWNQQYAPTFYFCLNQFPPSYFNQIFFNESKESYIKLKWGNTVYNGKNLQSAFGTNDFQKILKGKDGLFKKIGDTEDVPIREIWHIAKYSILSQRDYRLDFDINVGFFVSYAKGVYGLYLAFYVGIFSDWTNFWGVEVTINIGGYMKLHKN